jgi:hypothetical protein
MNSSPGRGKVLSPLHVVQTGCETHRTSDPMGIGCFPGGWVRGIRLEREVDHSHLTSAEGKNRWKLYIHPHLRLHDLVKHRNNFTYVKFEESSLLGCGTV